MTAGNAGIAVTAAIDLKSRRGTNMQAVMNLEANLVPMM